MILFNSGVSRHMSCHCKRFSNYTKIMPKPIMAADKHTFDTIGRGDLFIAILNRNSQTRVLLCNMLYVSKMGVTLVSVSKLNTVGYGMLF